jgi:hypothetical protein
MLGRSAVLALPARPAAHALYIFLCVVAVAVSVARSGFEVAPPLPRSEPLDRDAQLAGRLRDSVGGAPVLSHAPTIEGAVERVYRNWLGKRIPVLGPKPRGTDHATPPARRRTPWQVRAFVGLIPARKGLGTRVYTVLVRVTNRGRETRVLKAALRYSSVRKSIRTTTCGAGFHARLWK